MKKINDKIFIFVVFIILTITSIICIILNGKTYTIKEQIRNANSIDEIEITFEDNNDIVRCADKKFNDGILEVKFEALNKGKTWVAIKNKEETLTYKRLYVHEFGIITYENYFGTSTCGEIVPISIVIMLICILYILIKRYRLNLKKNIYQYKNITYIGLIIFLSFSLVMQLFSMRNYQGINGIVENMVSVFSTFSNVMLPIAFIVSIFVTISNIVLVKNEGINLKNFLGLILSIILCLVTIFPELLNNLLFFKVNFINVHNESGVELYIFRFINTAIYLNITYLESILIGTIILGRKSAKYIPEFNKDFIIILGCKIKKDGTLTNLLKSRVDRAIEFRNMQKEATGKDVIFVPSGGKGEDEIISEAQAMKNYLIDRGIDEKSILIEDKSKNTYENIEFSNKIIEDRLKDAKIAFSTTSYHVFRAGNIANNLNIKIEGIGAKTKSYFLINAFIREFIATMYSEKKKHFIIILSIHIVAAIMIAFIYLSNIL